MDDRTRQISLEKIQQQCFFKEVDFIPDEAIIFGKDVFSMTIAANLSKDCPPMHFNNALRQCFIVFMLEGSIFFFWLYDYKGA